MVKGASGKSAAPASSVKLQDVADRCGVSIITVSRALHNDPRVRQVTKERVRAAAHEVGYHIQSNAAARQLIMKRHGGKHINHLIALLVPPNFHHVNYFMHMFKGILDILSTKGYGLICCYPPDIIETDLPSPMLRDEIDGVILPGTVKGTSGVLEYLRAQPTFHAKPVVSLMKPLDDAGFIGSDGFSGAYQVGTHLLALGHRHLIHYYVDVSYEQAERLAGLRAAFAEYGLDPDTHLHLASRYSDPGMPEDISKEERVGTILNALRAIPHATAIITRSDFHAATIWNTLVSEGVRIPEDLSIVGYNDTDPFCDVAGQNLLTSVSVPLIDIGRLAAEMIVGLIAGNAVDYRQRVLPVELVARASTAPPRNLRRG